MGVPRTEATAELARDTQISLEVYGLPNSQRARAALSTLDNGQIALHLPGWIYKYSGISFLK